MPFLLVQFPKLTFHSYNCGLVNLFRSVDNCVFKKILIKHFSKNVRIVENVHCVECVHCEESALGARRRTTALSLYL